MGPPTSKRPVGLTSTRWSVLSMSNDAKRRCDHELLDVRLQQRVEVDVTGVLGRDDHGVDADRPVAVVLDGDLRLAVWAQVRDLAVAAHLRQSLGQSVRDRDRQGHELGGVVARVAEHQPLVAGTLPVERVGRVVVPLLVGVVDPLGDVRRLGADRHRDAAGAAVEALLARVVADGQDLLADQTGDVGVGGRGDLAGHVDQPGRHQRLDRHPTARVVLQQRIEDRVADLVGDLVGVTLGHGLRGEESACHVGVRSSEGVERWCRSLRVARGRGKSSDARARCGSGSGCAGRPTGRGPGPTPRAPARAWGRAGPPSRSRQRPRIDGGVVVGAERQTVADLVDDEQVAPLAGQLLPAVLQPVRPGRHRSRRRIRRPPDGPACAATRAASTSSVGSSTTVGCALALLQLVRGRGARPEVGDGRGHDHRICRRRPGEHGVLQLGGGRDGDRRCTPAGSGRSTLAATRSTCAPRAAAAEASA